MGAIMDSSISRRIEKAEKATEPENDVSFKWTQPDGTVIEIPGVYSFVDVIRRAQNNLKDDTESE